jgi:hypothetical protein
MRTHMHTRPALQPCVFRVDYALEAAGGREFGSVIINERENVGSALVANGLAKVGWGSCMWSCWV